jgi:hypothetical protein
MYYPISTCIFKKDYFEWITRYSPSKVDKFFNELDEEDYVNAYLIMLDNTKEWLYDELWLLEVENVYIPVLIKNINGSSPHALWSSSINEDDQSIEWTLNDLINNVGTVWQKCLKQIMETEYEKCKID